MLVFCSQDRKLPHVISYHRNEQNIGRAIYHCLQVTALGSSQGASMWGLKTKSCHPGGRKMGSSRHPPLPTKFRASQDFIRARTQNQTEKWVLRGAWVVTMDWREAIWSLQNPEQAKQRPGEAIKRKEKEKGGKKADEERETHKT